MDLTSTETREKNCSSVLCSMFLGITLPYWLYASKLTISKAGNSFMQDSFPNGIISTNKKMKKKPFSFVNSEKSGNICWPDPKNTSVHNTSEKQFSL